MARLNVIGGAAVAISAALLVLPRIFPICTGLGAGGKPMVCHYTFQAEFIIGLLALIVSASLFVLRTAEARQWSGFLLVLLGISVLVLPQAWAIGLCPHASGACHKTAFFINIGGSLLALTGGWAAWQAYRQQKNLAGRPDNADSDLEKSAAP
ncbi:DUF4418 family protein [Anaeroarcus burkinensis]|uniref:DUF4418 family protein n=1 Tax=Anaeroarcus burkinensis TaxID=82376 RepID=UPI0004262F2C|nr:DUF4418 family protein [Anaeroarcus burkinensis]